MNLLWIFDFMRPVFYVIATDTFLTGCLLHVYIYDTGVYSVRILFLLAQNYPTFGLAPFTIQQL